MKWLAPLTLLKSKDTATRTYLDYWLLMISTSDPRKGLRSWLILNIL
ncbi:hypothetical protein M8C21_011717 [Ambrosia artemisiifolia]|uniref:Uncharacterized protein n=1 Tax=Ambrosia artemisiifolia TaxID=4212 RepID=A0AAD5GFV8_AMBAR|nr:hypothetical protein M8C21_011717 [Ambrosia artemisiifolia]